MNLFLLFSTFCIAYYSNTVTSVPVARLQIINGSYTCRSESNANLNCNKQNIINKLKQTEEVQNACKPEFCKGSKFSEESQTFCSKLQNSCFDKLPLRQIIPSLQFHDDYKNIKEL